jgi:radical SAM superfamily enzyme YgiQ (UPF0313 family)
VDRRILLVNPPYSKVTYEQVDRQAGTLQNPVLGLATVAAPLLADGHAVRIADLDLEPDPYRALVDVLRKFRPHYVGVTGTTPMALEMGRVAFLVKEHCPEAVTVAGGVHVTTFPRQMLLHAGFDVAAVGEGDFTLRDLLRSERPEEVPGLALKRGAEIVMTPPRPLLEDLDTLPPPAWELFDIARYRTSTLVERCGPTGLLETSRGCPFGCVYCNKNIAGRRFRAKSPRHVVDEMARMLALGFREIHIEDDGFSTDVDRAKQICDAIVRRGLRFPWNVINGIRVDRCDRELFVMLRRAGCYQVAFGVEAGSQAVLDEVGKGTTKEAIRRAVAWCREAGIETFGFFMLGLPGETRASMQETIDFACELELDLAKFAITIPLPGTPLFARYEREDRILTRDWSRYLFHRTAAPVYRHPTLGWDEIVSYYKRAHRQFYWRPGFVRRRIARSLARGQLLREASYALRTKWW